MTNARTARDWALTTLKAPRIAKHFVAVSTNAGEVGKSVRHREHVRVLGLGPAGRYSMDSAIGLSTMIAIGPEHFREMLDGLHEMDEHFRTPPSSDLARCSWGLGWGLWYNNSSAPRPSRPAVRPVL